MHLFPATVAAIFRLNNRFIEKVGQMVGMLISPQNNIAAESAITAVGPAFGDEFFPPKTDASPSTLSGLRKNLNTIDKHPLGNCHCAPALSSRAAVARRRRFMIGRQNTWSEPDWR